MRIFPKVTRDFDEYRRLSGSSLIKPTDTSKGYYYNEVIYCKKLNFITILHEFTHHMFRGILGNWSGGARLIFDLVDDIQDLFYHYVKYKEYRDKKVKQLILKFLKEDLNDIITWYTCQ